MSQGNDTTTFRFIDRPMFSIVMVLALSLLAFLGVEVWKELRRPAPAAPALTQFTDTEVFNLLAPLRHTNHVLSDRIDALRDRVEALEARPKPRPGSLPSGSVGDAPKPQ